MTPKSFLVLEAYKFTEHFSAPSMIYTADNDAKHLCSHQHKMEYSRKTTG